MKELKVLFHIQKEKSELAIIKTQIGLLTENDSRLKCLTETKEEIVEKLKYRNPEKFTLNFSNEFIQLLNDFLVDLEKIINQIKFVDIQIISLNNTSLNQLDKHPNGSKKF